MTRKAGRWLVIVGILTLAFPARVLAAPGDLDPSPPYINTGYADRPIEPTHFSPNDVSETLAPNYWNSYVSAITWMSWGSGQAVGTGLVSLLEGNGATSPVTVNLGGKQDCAGVPVYTTYSLELAPGAAAPRQWPKGKTGTFPCERLRVYGYSPMSPEGCDFRGLGRASNWHEGGHYPRWQPKPPPEPETDTAGETFCYLRWRHWGQPTATAKGIREWLAIPHSEERYWPVELRLSDPLWCQAATSSFPAVGASAITYGRLDMTLWGKPRRYKGTNPSKATGQRRGKKQSFVERITSGEGECAIGTELESTTGVRAAASSFAGGTLGNS
jgi:hypothetical protein